MTIFCAAAIASTPFAGTAQALEKGEGTEQSVEIQSEEVNKITLNNVLEHVMENNHNFVMLKYQLEAAKNQTLSEIDGKADIQGDINDLYKKLDILDQEKARLEEDDEAGKNYNSQQRAQIVDAIIKLEDTIDTLKIRIKQLESGEFQLGLQQEEVRAALTLKVVSDYVSLLNLQQQRDFKIKEIEEAEKEVQRLEFFYKYGTASKEELDKAKKAHVNARKEWEKQENQYQHDLANLAFSMGIQYKPSLFLASIDFELEEQKKPNNVKTVIENTFQMKREKDNLEFADFAREEIYKDGGSNEYARKEKDYNVKIAEEKIKSLYQELTPKVEAIYYNVETAEFEYKEVLRQLEETKEEIVALEKRYRLGVVSKAEYDKALFQLQQLTLNAEMIKSQIFLSYQSIKALKQGYIQ